MMESIRTGVNKPWVKIVLGIVILSFVLAGGFTGFASSDQNVIAEVNGEPIEHQTWIEAVQREKGRYGQQFDRLFTTEEAKKQFGLDALDKLIRTVSVRQEIEKLGFKASDEQILEAVNEIEFFKDNGKFSVEKLDQLLVTRGWTREKFRGLIEEDITQSQFVQLFTDTEIALPYEKNIRVKLEQQERSVDALVLKAEKFEGDVEVTDELLNQYYSENLSNYEVLEKLTVNYIELNSNDLLEKVSVSDEDIATYYAANSNLYESEEERRVAHILVNLEERSEDEAKTKIDAIAERLKNGEDFAELAKTESDDFSGENGGDLGFNAKGVMVPEFEKVMFELTELNSVSDVVKTEFGFHIIKLLEIKSGEAKPLEEVKEQIVNQLKKSKAEDEFYALKEKVTQKSFERYESLSDAAAEAQLEIKTSPAISRVGNTGIFANQSLITEAFSDPVLLEKRNSQAINISDTHVVFVRANEHTPKRVKTFDEVKSEVTLAYKRSKAKELAQNKASEWIALLSKGESIAEQVKAFEFEWKKAENIRRNSTELGFELTRFAFKSAKPVESKPSLSGHSMANGDYAIVKVNSIREADITKLSDAEKQQAQARIQRSLSESSYTALSESLEKQSKVVKYPERIRQ